MRDASQAATKGLMDFPRTDNVLLTEDKPEEHGASLFRTTPTRETSLEVIALISVRVVVCILAPWLGERRDDGDKA